MNTQALYRSPRMVVSAFQLGTMIIGVMLSLGPLFIGRIAVENAGRDGWIVTTVASVIVMIHVWLMILLARRYPDLTISEYTGILLGKWVGKFVGSAFVILSLLSCAITIWYTGHLFNTYILLNTPSYVIALLSMMLTVYVALCELRTLGRVVVIIFFISMPFNLFFVPPISNHGDALALLPLLENDWHTLGAGVFGVLFAFAGYEVMQTYYAYTRDKKNIMKHVIWGVTFVCVLFILAVVTQQLVYPLEYLVKIWAPSVQYVALVTIPIFERTDMIFIMFWFLVLFKTNTMYFYRAVVETQHIMPWKRKNLLVIVFATLVFGLSFYSTSIIEMEVFLKWIFGSSVGLSLALTVILLLVDTWKKRSGSQ